MSLGILRILGIILFLYLSWRAARDNFKDEDLVTMSWLALLGFFAGGRITFGLFNWGVWNESIWDWFLFWQKPGFNYLGAYLGYVGSIVWYATKQDWKVWGLLEDLVNSTLILFSMYMLDETIRSRFDLESLTATLILLFGFGVANVMKGKYRSFLWYRSGKKGFVFFITNITVFLLLLSIGIWFKDGLIVLISYGVLSLISLAALIILGNVFAPLAVNRRKK